jgi:hypothetical protein
VRSERQRSRRVTKKGNEIAAPHRLSRHAWSCTLGKRFFYRCSFRRSGRQSSQMVLSHIVSGGSGRFF